MSYKWCSLFNMWCVDVEELIDVEGTCDLECNGCEHIDEEG
ncbi:hypothetical protein [Clostridium botulinum]|nr:hypothetical protein [Clostridium botulinum]BDB03756.1 hypothetical protein CBOS2020_38300 [Clostridium botulinum]